MTVTRTSARIASIVLLAVGGAACGGGDDDGGGGGDAASADSPLAQAIADSIITEDDALTTDRAEAECFAGGVVSELGEDRLTELGVTVESVGSLDEIAFTEDEISTVVDKMFGCIDVKASFAKSFEEDFGTEGAACLGEQMDEDFVRLALSGSLAGNEEPSAEFMQQFLDIAAECDLPIT